jgi:hypothetical protein
MGYVIALGIVAVPALIAAAALWRGYVLSILWGWFAVPIFGLPQLTVPAAIGVCLIVGMFFARNDEDNRSGWEKFGSSIAVTFIGPLCTLLVGWIVKGFM